MRKKNFRSLVQAIQAKRTVRDRDPIMKQAAKDKLLVAIARRLGLTHQAVSAWKQVPAVHVLAIMDILGKTPEEIRPDIFTEQMPFRG